MKQKVVTKAVIKQDERILLIRRSGGRPSIDGLFELPGGRIHYTQQPEDALGHALRIHMGVAPETTQLGDVMTFVDPDDRELQYVFIIYNVSLKPTDHTITLSDGYDKYIWRELSEIQRDELTHSTQQILGMQQIPFAPGKEPTNYEQHHGKLTTDSIILYTDGGSRGNPGPSASGFVVVDANEQVVAEGGAFLGISTNNVAEYQAVYLGLEKALELGAQNVDIRLDSQLVANQMNGIYRVKHNELLPIHARVRELILRFHKVTFTHVLREYNQLADGVVNKILDQHVR
jgi:ribonuclease HI/ADP-ribose pyrophosphatase YjhB (NUDIX family)